MKNNRFYLVIFLLLLSFSITTDSEYNESLEDYDGDGLPDAYELANDNDPFDRNDISKDADGDGLTIQEEFIYGTSDQNPDTDFDTLPDAWEVVNGRDPLLADYQISTGAESSCALTDNGVVCWGKDNGSLNVPNLYNPTVVAVGNTFACALENSEEICWGNNQESLIGKPSLTAGICAIEENGIVCQNDVMFGSPPLIENPAQVSTGESSACALAPDGVTCWGTNYHGENEVPALVIDPDGDGYSNQGGVDAFPLDPTRWLEEIASIEVNQTGDLDFTFTYFDSGTAIAGVKVVMTESNGTVTVLVTNSSGQITLPSTTNTFTLNASFAEPGEDPITLVDALQIIQYSGELRTLTADQLKAADVNNDGEVGILDALWIVQHLGELRTLDSGLTFLDANTGKALSETTFSSGDAIIISTFRTGDVDGDFDPTLITDHAPIFISNSNLSINEGEDSLTIEATDVDNDLISYYISGGEDQDKVIIDADTGVLTFLASPNYKIPTDSNSDNQYEITISISDDNEIIPVNAASNNNGSGDVYVIDSVQKKSLSLELGGTYTFNYPQAHPLRFSTVSDGIFGGGSEYSSDDIDTSKSGAIVITVTSDTPSILYYYCTVHSGMGASLTVSSPNSQAFTISVNNLNEKPTFTGLDSTVDVDENELSVSSNYISSSSDSNLTFTLTGPDASLFNINDSNGDLRFNDAPDYETRTTFSITITVNDGENTVSQDVVVNVQNKNESPAWNDEKNDQYGYDVYYSGIWIVDENTVDLGTIYADDVDGNAITFSLKGVDASSFTIDSSTGKISFASPPDYETKSIYSLTVVASDGEFSIEREIPVSIGDLFEYALSDSDRSPKPDLPRLTDPTFNVTWTPSKYNSCSDSENVSPALARMQFGLQKRYVGSGSEMLFEPSIFFADEATTVMIKKDTTGGSVTFEENGGLGFFAIDGTTDLKIYDDGTNGDLKANDGVYSRACLYFTRTLNDKPQIEGSYVVLMNSLRGTEAALTDIDVGVKTNDVGTFYSIGDDYSYNFKDLTTVLNYNFCFECQYQWHLYGNQFDMLMTFPRSIWATSGMSRVSAFFEGVGQSDTLNAENNYRFQTWNTRDSKPHQELMAGIIINPFFGNGLSHEVAHGILGMFDGDSDGTGAFPKDARKSWICGDNSHIDGNTTITGPLTGSLKYPQICGVEGETGSSQGLYIYDEDLTVGEMKSAKAYVDSNGDIKLRAYNTDTSERSSDLLLYMMGLKTKDEATGKDYKLINATCADSVTSEDRIQCKTDEVTYDEAILMDANTMHERYGAWGTHGITSYDPERVDIGVMFTSDRHHTEAEITHLSRLVRAWSSNNNTHPLNYGEAFGWSYVTNGLSEVKVDFRSDLLPTVDVVRGAITPNYTDEQLSINSELKKWDFSADDIASEAKNHIFHHVSARKGYTDSDDSQQYCVARYTANVVPHNGELYVQSMNVDDLRILSRENNSTNNWSLGDTVFTGSLGLSSADYSETDGSSNHIKVIKEGKYVDWPQLFNRKGVMKLDINNDDSDNDGNGCLKDLEFGINFSFGIAGDNTAGYSPNKLTNKHQGIYGYDKSSYPGTDGNNNGWTDEDITGDHQSFYIDGDYNNLADLLQPRETVDITEEIVTSSTFPDGFKLSYGSKWNGVATKLIQDEIFLIGKDNDTTNPTDRTLLGIGFALGGGTVRVYDVTTHDIIQMTD